MSKRKFYVQPVALDDAARARVTALYREEHRAVKAYLLRKGIEGAAAEDLCQDVFIHLLYAGPVRRGWLLGTARFVARAYRSLFVHQVEVLDNNRTVQNAAAPFREPDTLFDVSRALACLTEDECEVLASYALDGASLSELAARWGISKTSAHGRVDQARKSFRRIYASDTQGGEEGSYRARCYDRGG